MITSTICKHIHLVCRCDNSQDEFINSQGYNDAACDNDDIQWSRGDNKHLEKSSELNFLRECLRQTANNEGTSDRELKKKALQPNYSPLSPMLKAAITTTRYNSWREALIRQTACLYPFETMARKTFQVPKTKSHITKTLYHKDVSFLLAKPSKEEKISITETWRRPRLN